MNGKVEPTTQTDQQCSHCGLWFSSRGIFAHEDSCKLKGEPYRVQPEREAGEGTDDGTLPTGVESPDDSGGGLPDGYPPEDDVSEDPTGSGTSPTDADATDGGPGLGLTPPSSGGADTSGADPSGTSSTPTVDELPDRYVSVDEYLEAVDAKDHAVDVGALREQLAEYDVVDVQETSEEHIAAYTLEEVA
jgi:hypothetical protein